MKNIRQKVAGSLKKTMPMITAPTAPIPVQTGYTVPIGIDRAARAIRYILKDNEVRKPAHHQYCEAPTAVFVFPRQNVKATSINPAIIRIIQFISFAKLENTVEKPLYI